MIEIKIDGEYIKLDQLLKAANVADSGGQAKIMIHSGMVQVNGETVKQRGRKIMAGDEVIVDRAHIKVF